MRRIPTTKAERRNAIRERAAEAIRDMYHNATPLSFDDRGIGCEIAGDWFNDAAQFEIEYVQDGGAYGSLKSYRECLEAECNAGRYKSAAARRFYVKRGMRQMLEERAKCAAWESISEYGKLYQWGRWRPHIGAGQTRQDARRISLFHAENYADDMPLADVVELIRLSKLSIATLPHGVAATIYKACPTKRISADADESTSLELAAD